VRCRESGCDAYAENRIEVDTAFGRLVAEVGGDLANPNITLSL
jgi:hypothetical protein